MTVDNAGETEYKCRACRRNQESGYYYYYYYYTQFSDPVKITVRARPKPVASIDPDKLVFSGDAVTLRCDVQDERVSSWQYSWYKDDSRRPVSSEQVYTISGVEVTHTGKYTCKGAERQGSRSSHFSDAVTLTVSERPGAVLSVSPQSWLTEGDSVTLSCKVTDSSTDWTFSWYTAVPYRDGLTQIKHNHGYIMYVELLSDSSRGSGGKYTLSPAALNHTGVYMCRGERREPALHTQYSNPQPLWITGESPPVSLIINPSRTQHFTDDSLSLSCEDQINSTGWRVRRYTHNGDVILESPVHPVTEGHPLTLRCLYRYPKSSNLRADFYNDGSYLQTQTTGEMIIRTVSKSDEGFYHCKHPERGESLKSWVSVRASGLSGVEAPFSVLMLISSVVTASPYLLVTIILLVKCYRARAHTDEERIENAVIEE
ncbi:leukocyte immunoglobulin-like receptor subfamily B member 2 [Ictalurus punctatus]|uniref:Leukocyte immunoglobulin-like receptor subfamily B member 2 n=1 Tax=Ictalurus punctatus TaxID=7998 RepID=A0A9F7R7U2_ICTPU|nr:leukocyte immunoglobulin-like receptor subfamily B member 2 [Ictalurus punctatus]